MFDQPEIVAKEDVVIFLDSAIGLVEEVVKAADHLVVRCYPNLGVPRLDVSMKKE